MEDVARILTGAASLCWEHLSHNTARDFVWVEIRRLGELGRRDTAIRFVWERIAFGELLQ